MQRLLGTTLTPIYGPPRAGDVRDSQADIDKAARLLGYQPPVTFEKACAAPSSGPRAVRCRRV